MGTTLSQDELVGTIGRAVAGTVGRRGEFGSGQRVEKIVGTNGTKEGDEKLGIQTYEGRERGDEEGAKHGRTDGRKQGGRASDNARDQVGQTTLVYGPLKV